MASVPMIEKHRRIGRSEQRKSSALPTYLLGDWLQWLEDQPGYKSHGDSLQGRDFLFYDVLLQGDFLPLATLALEPEEKTCVKGCVVFFNRNMLNATKQVLERGGSIPTPSSCAQTSLTLRSEP